MDRWTEGQKDGQTLFYWTLPATAGGPIGTLKYEYKVTKSKNQRKVGCHLSILFLLGS